eukprot:TRINITY_DN26365_c0_g1_i1.p1 TRINITY_DN26365_c0_g1~~TRINITY_DN26365_c0_g1_i1.p1  ORF type:complete len:243 (-),score=43.44 TRINITY_DN26365_c0_g1_i1:1257-1985(-)
MAASVCPLSLSNAQIVTRRPHIKAEVTRNDARCVQHCRAVSFMKPSHLLCQREVHLRERQTLLSSISSPFSADTSRLLSGCGRRRANLPSASPSPQGAGEEEVFFDGGPHYGDLVINLVFGLTLVWLPLTLASVFRCLNLRYRFTNKRFTIISGLSDGEQRDFPYSAITDVKCVPRFIGEWGDIAITLSDKSKTVVEIKCVPKFREITQYCLQQAAKKTGGEEENDDVAGVTDAARKKKGFA